MKSEALARALTVSKQYPLLNKKGKRSALVELAAFGFNSLDIRIITGSSIPHIISVIGEQSGSGTPWEIKTLDALIIMSGRYAADGYISPVLLPKVMLAGTPLRSVARLTGIPLEELRSVL